METVPVMTVCWGRIVLSEGRSLGWCTTSQAWESPCTWNEYDPDASLAWSQGGASGAADSVLLGSLNLQADVPARLEGPTVQTAVQAMLDGAPPAFMLHKTSLSNDTVAVAAELTVCFDVDPDPNL